MENLPIIERPIRVMVIDDHPAIREGLRYRLSSQEDMRVCCEASSVSEALQSLLKSKPHVAIVDIALKDSDGLELLKEFKRRYPEIRTIVHSMYQESLYADRCLHAGAMGYVNKEANPDELIHAIHDVLGGHIHLSARMKDDLLRRQVYSGPTTNDPVESLTDRQLEIFRLLGEGLTVQQIADKLYISVHTVETHRDNIKRKFNDSSSSALTRRAVLWTRDQS